MKEFKAQMGKAADEARKRWKWLLGAAEILILLFAAVSYFRQAGSLVQYAFGEDDLKKYGGDGYEACFRGEIDESFSSGLYDVIPQEEMFLRKGCYQYTLTYEGASEGSFCWPHTYVEFYDVIEEAVTYLQEGFHKNTDSFWLNADLNVALRFFYSGQGSARITGFEIRETMAAANIRLFWTVLFLLGLNLVLGVCFYERKHGIEAEKKYVFAGLMAIGLFASYPFLMEDTVSGNDLLFHLARLEGIKDGLLSGQFPVRINPAFYNGYGYADPVFYGQILLYIPALLRLVGFGLTACYNVFGIMVNLLTCFGSYYCFQKMFKERGVAMAVTMLYVMAPYRMTDLYLRAAVGEYTALLFLPFVAYGIFRVFTEDTGQKRYTWCIWPLVLGLSGIIQSHVITGEIVGGLILLTCVVLLPLTLQRKRLWALVKTVLYTVVLNAWFLVPMADFALTQKVWITMVKEPERIQKTGLFLPQLLGMFPGYSLITRDAGDGIASEMPLYLGIGLVLGLILCAAMVWVVKKEMGQRKGQALFFGLLAILTAWMSTVYFPWDRLSTMFSGIPWIAALISNIQFVWRFLAVTTLAAAVATGFGLLFLYRREGKQAFAIAAVALCLLTGIGDMYLMHQCLFLGETVHFNDLLNDNTANFVSGAEYTLEGADYQTVTEVFEPRAYGGIVVSDYEKNGTSIHMTVEGGEEEGYVLLPLLAYKGYHVKSEGGILTDADLSMGENAVVRLDIPAGYSGEVSVRYGGFWYWRVAEALSAVTLLSLGMAAWKRKRGGFPRREGSR